MSQANFVVTRRFSVDGPIVDYLMDWCPEHGTICTMMLDRAMKIDAGVYAAMNAANKARGLVPSWCRTEAEQAAGLQGKPILWGIAEVKDGRVIPLDDAKPD